MKVCADSCNGQKHFKLDSKHHPNPKVKDATTRHGYGVGRYKGAYGVGEQSVEIELSDGSSRNALDLVRNIAAKWAAV